MVTFTSHSPAQTESLGESWGRAAAAGDVFLITGDLGAGKTQLVRGIARGLGIAARVHSPTFTLVNSYAGGRLPLVHLDLYRLDTPEQIHSAGLDEFLQTEGVAVIEWAERLGNSFAGGEFGAARRRIRSVRIEIPGELERLIVYEDSGD
jgi:tRNA threonylcarbamoyladenosine biosynthesis protein TsaE